MITVEHITKTYRIARRDAGFLNACKSFFHREYDEIRALDDISFTIQDGEMVGYIGPNGAGKSSTIKILSGILTPDSGTCLINGRIPWKDRIRHASQIGVVFGQRTQLWWDVPVADSFDLLKDIYRIDPALYRKNRDDILETQVGILEYDGGVSYHGKCFVIDDRLSGIGSFNWDMRSAYLDTELMLVIDSEQLNADMRAEMAEYEKKALTVVDENTVLVPDGMTAQQTGLLERLMNGVLSIFAGWARFLM